MSMMDMPLVLGRRKSAGCQNKSSFFLLMTCMLLLLCSQGLAVAQGNSPAPSPFSLDSLPELTATEAVALLCSRQITAVEYVQSLLDRLDSGWECLNAFSTINTTQVLNEATAIDAKADSGESILPLCGLPLAVKDSVDVVGYPTTASTPALQDAYPPTNAPLINTYRQANGIILGKTRLAELSSSSTSINPNIAGVNILTPLNAYNQTRHTGGSSGGSAVAVAAHLAPLAVCEDTGGSCRLPSSANGVFGIRPTVGCYNYTGGLVIGTFTRDTLGSMARNMDDLILLDSIVRSNGTTDGNGLLADPVSCKVDIDRSFNFSGVRIGLPSTFGWQYPGFSDEVANVTNAAIQALQEAGAVLVPFDSSVFTSETNVAYDGTPESLAYEEPDAHARYLWSHIDDYAISLPEMYLRINRPDLRARNLGWLTTPFGSIAQSAEAWVQYLSTGRPKLQTIWADQFTYFSLDVMLYPVFSTSPRPIDATEPYVAYANGTVINFVTTQFTGMDAQVSQAIVSVPIGLSTDGLPAALQVSSLAGNDSYSLSFALALEKLLGNIEPPSPPACTGCAANVTYKANTWNGVGQPTGINDTWSFFGLTYEGCPSNGFFSEYGRSGIAGRGPQGPAYA